MLKQMTAAEIKEEVRLAKLERRAEKQFYALKAIPKYKGPTVIPVVVDGRNWLVTLSSAFRLPSVHQSATDFLRRSATVAELLQKMEALEKAQGVTLGLIEGSSELYLPTLNKIGNVAWNQAA